MTVAELIELLQDLPKDAEVGKIESNLEFCNKYLENAKTEEYINFYKGAISAYKNILIFIDKKTS